MGDVAISIRIMPENTDTDINKIKNEISKIMNVKDAKIEPIAFGLKSLKILIIIPDKGGTEQIEKEIKKIDGVADVQIESVTLV